MGVPRQALEIGDVARPGKGLNEKRELIAPLGGGLFRVSRGHQHPVGVCALAACECRTRALFCRCCVIQAKPCTTEKSIFSIIPERVWKNPLGANQPTALAIDFPGHFFNIVIIPMHEILAGFILGNSQLLRQQCSFAWDNPVFRNYQAVSQHRVGYSLR